MMSSCLGVWSKGDVEVYNCINADGHRAPSTKHCFRRTGRKGFRLLSMLAQGKRVCMAWAAVQAAEQQLMWIQSMLQNPLVSLPPHRWEPLKMGGGTLALAREDPLQVMSTAASGAMLLVAAHPDWLHLRLNNLTSGFYASCCGDKGLL